jgi:DNA-binding NarL/FixJ family response regulator
MLKVLIADDHAIVRKGLREILRDSAEEVVIEEASDGAEALDKVRQDRWDLIILDITMPQMTGFAVLEQIKRDDVATPVLMLSMHANKFYVQNSLRLGAAGYLSKEAAPDELLTAISVIREGGRYLSQGLEDMGKP